MDWRQASDSEDFDDLPFGPLPRSRLLHRGHSGGMSEVSAQREPLAARPTGKALAPVEFLRARLATVEASENGARPAQPASRDQYLETAENELGAWPPDSALLYDANDAAKILEKRSLGFAQPRAAHRSRCLATIARLPSSMEFALGVHFAEPWWWVGFVWQVTLAVRR